MIRLIALWSIGVAALILAVVLREERLIAQGKVPLGRLRRLWFRADRRRAPRYRVNWGIRYNRMEPSSPQNGQGQTRDVSQSGAGLTVSEKLPVGALLRLELTLPDRPAPLPVEAEVVWIKEAIPLNETQSAPDVSRHFFVGIRFHRLSPSIEQQLREVLSRDGPS